MKPINQSQRNSVVEGVGHVIEFLLMEVKRIRAEGER